MKAGIYKTPNGNLIYVAKDRTIKATSLSPSTWPGTKVSHRSKDDTVVIEGTGYRCTRHSDVPNGCTDPAGALRDAMEALRGAPLIAGLADAMREQGGNPATLLIGDAVELSERDLRKAGYRVCHRQSARKHRRKRREVIYVPSLRAYTWRERA